MKIFCILILVKIYDLIFIKNSSKCTPTRENITVCKLELSKPDLVKELLFTKIFLKRLWDTVKANIRGTFMALNASNFKE